MSTINKTKIDKSINVSGTLFNVSGFVGWTKDKFVSIYKGKIKGDIDASWNAIQKELIAEGLIEETKKVAGNSRNKK